MSSFYQNAAGTEPKAKRRRRVIERACQCQLGGIAEGLESRVMLSSAPGPWVLSINRTSPSGSIITGSTTSVSYTVTFSEAVTGVAPADFSIPTTGDLTDTGLIITPVSSSIYTVTINGIAGRGTIGLNLVDSGAITDLSGDPLQSNPGGPITLQSPATFATGNAPTSVAEGDLNGDGKPDLVVANSNDSTIGVLMGNGNGTFSPQVTYAPEVGVSQFYIRNVVIADVNGDSHPDLIAEGGSAITVLQNNGNGTFAAAYTIANNISPGAMTVADLNGDGVPDIIWASYSTTDLVHVMIGNGNGTFKAPVTYAIQASYGTLTVADLSNGEPDLIVGGEGVSDIDVLLNNGNGIFAPATTLATGYAPSSYTVADVNGDGTPDIIVANEGDGTGNNGNSVSVLIGNTNGTFKSQVSYAVGGEPYGIQAADFNGDGKLDLVTSNFQTGTLSVLEGNGDGTFQPQVTFAVGKNPDGVSVGDFNGDKRPDIVVPVSGANEVEVYLGAVDNFTGQTYTRQIPYLTVATEPVTVEAGQDDLVIVDVYTAQGTLNTNDASTVTLTISSGKFGSGITTQTAGAVGGVAKFQQMYIYKTGTYTLSVTDPGDDPTTTIPFTVATGPVTTSTITVRANPTQIDPGQTSTLTLTAFDDYGNPATGIPVSYAETGAGTSSGTIGPVTDNGDGTYTATFTGVTAGTPRAILATFGGGENLYQQEPTITVESPPVVTSISAQTPSTEETSAGSVSYAVTFSQPVTGVTSSCFEVIDTGSVATSPTVAVAGSGTSYVVTVSGIHGSGNIQLELVDKDTIVNSIGVPLGSAGIGNGSYVRPPYTIAQSGPTVATITRASGTNAGTSAAFTVTFNEPVTGVVAGDFSVPLTGTAAYTGAVVSEGPSVYTVTVNGITGSGTLGLNLVDNAAIRDLNGNPLQTTVTPASFSAGTSYAVGSYPNSMAIGDLNGDGHPDIVTTNGLSDTVDVLIANGNGTYKPQVTYLVGTSPSSVAIADVNGDGKPDIIVTCAGGIGLNFVGILLGNGDGTFKPEYTYAVGAYPANVVVTDLNHDGKPDIVLATSAYSGPDGFQVLMGNGDGTFQTPVTYTVNTFSGPFVVGDLNNDGIPDIAAITGTNQISVMIGNGDGTFKAAQTFSVGLISGDEITDLVEGDFNGDGTPDLAAIEEPQDSFNLTSNDVMVFMGNGNGTFQAPASYLIGEFPNTYPVTLAVGDLNGDGSPDIVVGDQDGVNLGLYLNKGNGIFQAEQFLSQSYGPYIAGIVDVNGDGRADLVTAEGSDVVVNLNQGADNVIGPTYIVTSPITTTVAVTSNNNASTYGQSVTLTATISPASGSGEMGTVQFMDGSNPLGSAQTVSGGVATLTTTGLNATIHSITAVYTGDSNFQGNTSPVFKQTVNTAMLTITPAAGQSMVYGSMVPALTETPSGFQNGDLSTIVTGALGTNAMSSSPVGNYAFTLGTLSAGSNYALALASSPPTFAVTRATLTITPAAGQSMVYGSTVPALTETPSGFQNSDPTTIVTGALGTTAMSASPVGNYAFTLGTLSAGNNYTLALASSPPTFAVTRATLTITPAAGQSMVYGSTVPALTETPSGFQNGDPTTIVTGALGTTATSASPVGNYAFTLGTLSAGNNYTLALSSSLPTFAVTRATLTITPAAGQSMVYGSTVPALTETPSGFQNSDPTTIVTGALGTTATSASPVGNYAFTLGTLSAGNNYTLALSSSPPTFAVTRAMLTITPAAGQSMVYGSTVPALTETPSGFQNSDPTTIVTGALGTTATSASPVANYAFTLGTLSAGSNYTLVLASSPPTFAVTRAMLTITPTAGQSMVYGSTVPALTETPSGFQNGDPTTIVTGALGTTATSASPVGNYAFTLGTLSAGNNYTLALSSSPPTFAVTRAMLTITPAAGQSMVYGSTVPALTETPSGFQNGDPTTIVTGALGTTAISSSPVGNYAFTLGTLSAGNNYTLALASSPPTFAVTRATLTIAPTAGQSMVAGSTVPALTEAPSGFVNGDLPSIVTGALGTTATSASPAGNYPFTLGTLSAGSNYTVVIENSPPTFAVTQAAVTGGVTVNWGTTGSAALFTAGDGLRLLPAGRNTDLPWANINKLTITLSAPATLSPADVSVTGLTVANYGPVTISGSGTRYTITLARPIAVADRVTITIGNANIATFTRRIDVLPGDINDDGVVNAVDLVDERNQILAIGGATPTIFGDINGDSLVNATDLLAMEKLIGTQLPATGGVPVLLS